MEHYVYTEEEKEKLNKAMKLVLTDLRKLWEKSNQEVLVCPIVDRDKFIKISSDAIWISDNSHPDLFIDKDSITKQVLEEKSLFGKKKKYNLNDFDLSLWFLNNYEILRADVEREVQLGNFEYGERFESVLDILKKYDKVSSVDLYLEDEEVEKLKEEAVKNGIISFDSGMIKINSDGPVKLVDETNSHKTTDYKKTYTQKKFRYTNSQKLKIEKAFDLVRKDIKEIWEYIGVSKEFSHKFHPLFYFHIVENKMYISDNSFFDKRSRYVDIEKIKCLEHKKRRDSLDYDLMVLFLDKYEYIRARLIHIIRWSGKNDQIVNELNNFNKQATVLMDLPDTINQHEFEVTEVNGKKIGMVNLAGRTIKLITTNDIVLVDKKENVLVKKNS